jgi:hypothetical protein
MGWFGTFINDSNEGPAFAVWPRVTATGKEGGPTALFDLTNNNGGGNTLVLSPSSQFMSHVITTADTAFLMAGMLGTIDARCAFLDQNSHSRMPLVLTPARLKRACV